MKYLEIRDNKGYYWNGNKMVEIDQINKDDILSLLNYAEKDDFEMDEYNAEKLQNEAHRIIYQGIYGKFNDFIQNKESFNKQVELLYAKAIGEYDVDIDVENGENIDVDDNESEDDDIDPSEIPF